MGEWTSNLGVLDPRYVLEITKQLHIDFRRKVIENFGVELLSQPDLAQLSSLESCIILRIP